jgi:hypothetical protein
MHMLGRDKQDEIESLLSLHTLPTPAGIERTIQMEAMRAFERLAA